MDTRRHSENPTGDLFSADTPGIFDKASDEAGESGVTDAEARRESTQSQVEAEREENADELRKLYIRPAAGAYAARKMRMDRENKKRKFKSSSNRNKV